MVVVVVVVLLLVVVVVAVVVAVTAAAVDAAAVVAARLALTSSPRRCIPKCTPGVMLYAAPLGGHVPYGQPLFCFVAVVISSIRRPPAREWRRVAFTWCPSVIARAGTVHVRAWWGVGRVMSSEYLGEYRGGWCHVVFRASVPSSCFLVPGSTVFSPVCEIDCG